MYSSALDKGGDKDPFIDPRRFLSITACHLYVYRQLPRNTSRLFDAYRVIAVSL